jgi:hypothetical protein
LSGAANSRLFEVGFFWAEWPSQRGYDYEIMV